MYNIIDNIMALNILVYFSIKCLSVTMTFVRLLKATKDGRRVLSLCRLKLRYFSANYESKFSIR